MAVIAAGSRDLSVLGRSIGSKVRFSRFGLPAGIAGRKNWAENDSLWEIPDDAPGEVFRIDNHDGDLLDNLRAGRLRVPAGSPKSGKRNPFVFVDSPTRPFFIRNRPTCR